MILSIILPVYNPGAVLDDCINRLVQSIDEENKQEIEILIIDDGSTDGSVENLDDCISDCFPQLRIIHISHMGVAKARNYGLANALGEYVQFIDVDDVYVGSAVFHKLFPLMKNHEYSVFAGSFSDENNFKYTTSFSGDLDGYTFKNDGIILYRDYQFDYGFHRFIFERDFLIDNKILFPDLIRFQDPPFLVNALYCAEKFYAIKDVIYCYRVHDDIKWDEKKIADCISGIALNVDFSLKKLLPRLYWYSLSRLVRLLYDHLIQPEWQTNKLIIPLVKQFGIAINNGFNDRLLNDEDFCKLSQIIHLYSLNRNSDITIVIPVYNVGKYLRQCLESIVFQTDSLCRTIIVNDGSTDNSQEICEEFLLHFPCMFELINTDNHGLGAARNIGLKKVNTKYVSFLDSDDWLDAYFIKNVSENLEKYNPDLLFTLPKCYDNQKHTVYEWMDHENYISTFCLNENDSSIFTGDKGKLYKLEVNANRKVYRVEFLNELNFTFPEGTKWEDLRPHIQLCHFAGRIVGISNTGMYYRTNLPNQITSRRGAERLDFIDVVEDFLSCINDDYSNNEISEIMSLIIKYSLWMIEMTDVDYIYELIAKLHLLYLNIPQHYYKAYLSSENIKIEDKSIGKGFFCLITGHQYMKLTDYDKRNGLYKYWLLNNGKRKNIVGGALQCIKDSGFKYFLIHAYKKIIFKV